MRMRISRWAIREYAVPPQARPGCGLWETTERPTNTPIGRPWMKSQHSQLAVIDGHTLTANEDDAAIRTPELHVLGTKSVPACIQLESRPGAKVSGRTGNWQSHLSRVAIDEVSA